MLELACQIHPYLERKSRLKLAKISNLNISNFLRELLMSLRIYFLVELPSVGYRTYVDPTIYDKPEDALTEFTSEINPSTLFLEMMIGGGKKTMTTPIEHSLKQLDLRRECFLCYVTCAQN